MFRNIAVIIAITCLVLAWQSKTAISQDAGTEDPVPPQAPAELSEEESDLQRIQLELQNLQNSVSAREEAQGVIQYYLIWIASIISLMAILGLLLQFLAFRVEAKNHRQNQVDYSKQRKSEDVLNSKLLQVLDVASKATEDTQRKLESLQEGGIKRAANTLRLINNLLAITERSAARAAGAQYEFLVKSIETFDSECRDLILGSTRADERDIVAKQENIERVKILTKQIESLDREILTYNASVPRDFGLELDNGLAGADDEGGMKSGGNRLSLTGPSLVVRGLYHHIDQNFSGAIADWKNSIAAPYGKSIAYYSNYWIGYVSNTRGKFDEAATHINAAIEEATDLKIPELRRLGLETKFFDLDIKKVPDELVEEGKSIIESLPEHVETTRARANFATTIGNICLIRAIRNTSSRFEFSHMKESLSWYDVALGIEDRTRWARFGKQQAYFLMNGKLDSQGEDEVKDAIDSVGREYQARQEDRSKALSMMTEYMGQLMLSKPDFDRISTVIGMTEYHASKVLARTLYSQFRKQNVSKDVFFEELRHLRETMDLSATFRMANGI